ncbi:hypothetical protein FACS189426_16220 [Bacteroidia bacterium]|nr:hypothetical protein FACS189426_16220 [Bacteroidia bacterium]
MEQFLEINEVLPEMENKRGRKKKRPIIGQLGGGKDKLSGIVDVAIVHSLIHNNEVNDIPSHSCNAEPFVIALMQKQKHKQKRGILNII